MAEHGMNLLADAVLQHLQQEIVNMDNEISQLEESLTPHRHETSPRPPVSNPRVVRPTPAPRSRASTPQLVPTPVPRGTITPSILEQHMLENPARDAGTTTAPRLRASTPQLVPTPVPRRMSTPSILVQQAQENPAQDAGTDQRSLQPPVVPSVNEMEYQPTAGQGVQGIRPDRLT